MPLSPEPITLLLAELEEGRPETVEKLFLLIRPRFHQIAESLFRRERDGHTLQPTILVDDAFLQLSQPGYGPWKDRTHFFAFAALCMRRILTTYARAHNAQIRGGGIETLELDEAHFVPSHEKPEEWFALEQAIRRLEALDKRQAAIVELRFLIGLSVDETAQTLNLSPSTVKSDWKFARAFLRREVEDA